MREVLTVWGARYCVFQSAGKLLEIQVDPGKNLPFLAREIQTPRMVTISATRARALAAEECTFGREKTAKDGSPTMVPCLPPDWLGSAIVTRPNFTEIPVFAGLSQAPTLRRDGGLIRDVGYDCSTGIYLAEHVPVTVPELPTIEDARHAVAHLLDLVSDFDFVNAAGKSVWLQGVLSLVCRHTFSGPAPMTIIDASKKGSGKTTLADLASIIAMGTKAPRMFFTDDDTEMDKRITSLGIAGEQFVLIDNIVGKFASPPLDAALTSESYKGRVLGKIEMTPAVPMKIVWFATGNGIVIGADMARRALLARLEPTTDHPEDRTGPRPGQPWKYPRLTQHVQQYREAYLSSALTVVRAYVLAGRPNMHLTPMGSFEDWSDTIRAAIVWSGACDPCNTVGALREADLQENALRTMVECWPVADDVEVTTPTLLGWAEMAAPPGADQQTRNGFENTRTLREMWRNALLEWLPAKQGVLPTPRELGYALRSIKGAVVNGYKVDSGAALRSGVPWCRKRVAGPDTAAVPAPPSVAAVMTVMR